MEENTKKEGEASKDQLKGQEKAKPNLELEDK